MKREIVKAGRVWIALVVLLAATCGSAFLPLGVWNGIVNIAIAAAKALLVALFFMHLRDHRPALRLVVAGALFTLALLLGLTQSDYATRARYTAPWQSPEGAISSAR